MRYYKKYSVIVHNGTFMKESKVAPTMIAAFNSVMADNNDWTEEEKIDVRTQFERCRKRISKIYKQDSFVTYTGINSVTIRRYWA